MDYQKIIIRKNLYLSLKLAYLFTTANLHMVLKSLSTCEFESFGHPVDTRLFVTPWIQVSLSPCGYEHVCHPVDSSPFVTLSLSPCGLESLCHPVRIIGFDPTWFTYCKYIVSVRLFVSTDKFPNQSQCLSVHTMIDLFAEIPIKE